MSAIFQKLNEVEGQIDAEVKTIDRKIKDLKHQRQKLTGIKKDLTPKSSKPRRTTATKETTNDLAKRS